MAHLVLEKLYSLVLVPLKQTVRHTFTEANCSLQTPNERFSNIPQVSWIGIGSNVYWWWCKIGQRCIRIRIEFFLISNTDFSKTSIPQKMIVRKNGNSIFALKLGKAKEKQPTIIFIDEIDAIGTKRFDSEKAGDREVQRTMLELLSQLDGFEESNI